MSEGLLLIVLCSFRHNDKDLVSGDSCSGGRVLAYRLVV